ncbi:MAG: hypothetical protein K6E75_06600, partial [Lachnospiraceae bacterium]|nr:hypothetical protein [Lachnospiraceae bacterium]
MSNINDQMDVEDHALANEAQTGLERGAETAAKRAGLAILKKFGLYILIAFLFFTAVLMIILLFMGPSLAAKAKMEEIFESLFPSSTVSDNSVSGNSAQFEEWAYDPNNLLPKIDELFDLISTDRTGYLYLTKDNMRDILDYVARYQSLIRSADNRYTYYHHHYKVDYTQQTRVKPDVGDDGTTDPGATVTDNTQSGGSATSGNVNPTGVNPLGTGEGGDGTPSGTDTTSSESETPSGANITVDSEYVDPDTGETMQNITVKTVEDTETYDPGTVRNESIENDPLFKVSWEEIMTFAAQKSIVQETEEETWEVETSTEPSTPKIDAKAQLDPNMVKQIINSFAYTVGYYFDPTSQEPMPNSTETYAGHTYAFTEMGNYAYTLSEVGTDVPHGTETDDTDSFDYYLYKKPAVAPAEAFNAYCTVQYLYTPQADGTELLTGREITYDGQRFADYGQSLLGDDFNFDWFVEFVSLLPGSHYDNGQGTVADRFTKLLESYNTGVPIVEVQTSGFPGCGQVYLGSGLDKTHITHTAIRYTTGNGGEGGQGG